MHESFSWIAILCLLGAAQGVFLSVSLFSSKAGNVIANRYLAALTLLFTASLLNAFLNLTGLNHDYVELSIALRPKAYWYGVLIYFYVRELTSPIHVTIKGGQWCHFAPAALHVITAWSLFFLSSEQQSATLFNKDNSLLSLALGPISLTLSILHMTTYLALSFRLLRRHRQRIKQSYSSIEAISLNWLTYLLVGIFIIYSIWLVNVIITHFYEHGISLTNVLTISVVMLIYIMGYLGLRQVEVYSFELQNPDANSHVEQTEKYKSSPLTDSISLELIGQLKQLMDSKQPYLNNQLSLTQLAEQLDVAPHYLSQAINEQLQQNFFDFINHYRLEEAKRRLAAVECKKDSILTIAMDSGFNSKSSFYKAFKKESDLTPSQYRQQAH